MTEEINEQDINLEDDDQQDSGSPDVKRLEKELAKARKQAGGYRVQRNELSSQIEELRTQLVDLLPLRDLATTLAPQLEQIQSQLSEQTAARQQAELQTLRLQAAASAGLPAELANRLQGATAEEIAADAAALANALPVPRQARPGNGSLPTPESMAKELLQRSQRGAGSKAFDAKSSLGRGGGVIDKKE